MRFFGALIALVAISVVGCKKTGDGTYEVKTPTVDVNIGTRKDTLTTPTMTTKPETVIVNKPVVKPPPE